MGMISTAVPADSSVSLLGPVNVDRDVTVTISPGAAGLAGIGETQMSSSASEGAILQDTTTRFLLPANVALWIRAPIAMTVGVITAELPRSTIDGLLPGASGAPRCG